MSSPYHTMSCQPCNLILFFLNALLISPFLSYLFVFPPFTYYQSLTSLELPVMRLHIPLFSTSFLSSSLSFCDLTFFWFLFVRYFNSIQFFLSIFSSLSLPFFLSLSMLQRLLDIFRDDQYVISIRKQSSSTCEIHLLLKEKASKKDLLLGLIHAFIVRYSLKCKGFHDASKFRFMNQFNPIQRQKVTESTYDILVRTRILINKSSESIQYDDKLNSMNKMNIDISNKSDGEIDMKKRVSVGLTTVEKVLNSQWLVEELLLETRHARLVIT